MTQDEENTRLLRRKYYLNRKGKHNAYCVKYHKTNKRVISTRKKQWYKERTVIMAKLNITKADLKSVSLNQLLDDQLGKVGTRKRDKFEYDTDLIILNYFFREQLRKKSKKMKS